MCTTASKNDPIGIVLLNLGGPQQLADVRPFLYNLFSDRQIIRLGPFFLQKPIAWMIATRRAPKSSESYRLIGGGSPLNRITRQQGDALAAALDHFGRFSVDMAMRYWHPFARETLKSLSDRGIRKIVALTLYPHYSVATTGSSLEDLKKTAQAMGLDFSVAEVAFWPEQVDYVADLAATITDALPAAGADAALVYSAHSLPVKFINEGDPYLAHLLRTIAAVEKLTGKTGQVAFQSRSGPVEWLAPSTPDTIKKLAGEGVRTIVMVPISFVSDHVETLYEIDIQYRELAESLGVQLVRTESLNTRPRFIAGLASLVLDACRNEGWLAPENGS